MGIDCPALTPKGLYKWLLDNGALKLEGYSVTNI